VRFRPRRPSNEPEESGQTNGSAMRTHRSSAIPGSRGRPLHGGRREGHRARNGLGRPARPARRWSACRSSAPAAKRTREICQDQLFDDAIVDPGHRWLAAGLDLAAGEGRPARNGLGCPARRARRWSACGPSAHVTERTQGRLGLHAGGPGRAGGYPAGDQVFDSSGEPPPPDFRPPAFGARIPRIAWTRRTIDERPLVNSSLALAEFIAGARASVRGDTAEARCCGAGLGRVGALDRRLLGAPQRRHM
jgi:hypothetical protein